MRTRKVSVNYPLEAFRVSFAWNRKRFLLITGPTNVGKTALAKALLSPSPLLVTHLDDQRIWDPELYTGMIYDEMSIKHLPRGTTTPTPISKKLPCGSPLRFGRMMRNCK